MLTDIVIRNFAIIDSLHLSFSGGFTVLTGETGAGKSIIIDAVNLLLGGRVSSDLIRTGADEASVEAIFDVTGYAALRQSLSGLGIDCTGELLVKRTISRSGKNRIFMNGSLATLATLGEVTSRLINIYGQHEHQSLLRVENHLRLFDSYAALDGCRDEFAALFREHRAVREQLSRFESGVRDAERQRDLLSFQFDEIAKAALRPGEDEELEQERNLLVNVEKLASCTLSAFDRLYGAEASALGMIDAARSALNEGAAVDASLAPLLEAVSSAYLQIEDAALSLRDYNARIEADPQRLQWLDDRLESMRKLKRKYGQTIAEILAAAESFKAQLTSIDDADASREELDREVFRLGALLSEKGAGLTAAREAASERFCRELESQVGHLGMKHALFTLRFERFSEPREFGYERVEILFAPNPGEEPRPLARIASGGELSRVMLAMKQIHPESDVPTLIFDEVDTGIGGSTAAMVGRKLRVVAARQQVLCITHLPQVAVCADNHCRVAKQVVDGRTRTEILALDGDGRVSEIARMLGGDVITAKTLEHAAEMIQSAKTA